MFILDIPAPMPNSIECRFHKFRQNKLRHRVGFRTDGAQLNLQYVYVTK